VIDRRMVLICVTLITLMVAGAVWRIIMLEDLTVLAAQQAWTPSMGSPPALFILIAAAFLLVWSITCRRHLGRKWRLEQLAAG
jgi:hypothetical protein